MAELKLLAAYNIYNSDIIYTEETLTKDCIDLVKFFDCDNVIKKAIKYNFDISNLNFLVNKYNFTKWNWALQGAAEYGNIKQVYFFIDKGTKSINEASATGTQSLNWNLGLCGAARSNNKHLIRLFIEKVNEEVFADSTDAHIKYNNLWNAGIIGAVRSNNIKLIKFFIKKNEETSDLSINWQCCLDNAARYNNNRLVKMFIFKGANNWQWGLNNAARGGHLDLVKFFINMGAKNFHVGRFFARMSNNAELIAYLDSKCV